MCAAYAAVSTASPELSGWAVRLPSTAVLCGASSCHVGHVGGSSGRPVTSAPAARSSSQAASASRPGKNEASLDHYQVRQYTAWYRYVTLAMFALAWLAVTRAELAEPGQPGGTADSSLTTTANEIRHLFTTVCGPPPDEKHNRRWS
jgi:hypothetical protein